MQLIPLTQGRSAIVDDADYDHLSQWKWYFSNRGYAVRNIRTPDGKQTAMQMHRQIMDPPAALTVDHRNCNGIDNRRANLRLATALQQSGNRRVQCNSRVGLKGVRWKRREKRYEARIGVAGNRVILGTFTDPLKAAEAYDAAARRRYGEFARTNGEAGTLSYLRRAVSAITAKRM